MNRDDALRRALTSQLLQSGRQWRRIAEAELKSLGLSEALAMPLIWASRLGGGVRQITLAARIGIEGASLVRLLDQLVGAGLIERRAHPQDRRANAIWLTAAGEQLAGKIEKALNGARAATLDGMPASDLEATMRVLKAIEAAAASQGGAARDG
ncbi:MarR family winged helix-turn-helix transcriptional regulator [Camelimonas sp. ID_303_24]